MDRFRLFTVLSVVIHAGLFAGAVAVNRPPIPQGTSGATATGSGEAAAIGGETFDVPELAESPEESASEAIELDGPSVAQPAAPTDPLAPAEPATQPASAAASAPHASTGRRSARHAAAPPPPPPPALYGAVGDRAAGDLVDTFKRTFPIAASHDALWNDVPIGFYAGGDVTFSLAADGALEHATVTPASAPAFRAAIGRTVALLKHRVFTAKGATTRLHMVVRVTDRVVNHCAFTIDARGNFDLPSCRHISVDVTER